ncbi:Hpt domain-containing protein [Pelagibaculum spongiae]|uniref:Hpt domain-containing protein n=1 Tax=Pelagibaculum spongiae TaxID=2080658 RepID=UPI0013145BC1|nr:Hpt domain-containing protein [Pelagibaculum spongiae]
MTNTEDFSPLSWILPEIRKNLKQVQDQLENQADNPPPFKLESAIENLHQVHGCLRMVETDGSALLAEEMEQLAKALTTHKVETPEEGLLLLLQAVMQLPVYLEQVSERQADNPMVLLPLLNELRAVRKAPLLSESAVFNPSLAAAQRISLKSEDLPLASFEPVVRRLRLAYQVGLLRLIRGESADDWSSPMKIALERLDQLCGVHPMGQLWWVVQGVIESLQAGGTDQGTAIKLLLAQVDSQMRQLVQQGRGVMGGKPPEALMKSLLFYVARSTSDGSVVAELREAFNLHSSGASDAELEQARESLRAPDAEIQSIVAEGIREELAKIRSLTDMIAESRGTEEDPILLASKLQWLSDTLAMLGAVEPRQMVVDQLDAINMNQGELPQEMLNGIAEALVMVEATLDGKNTTNKEALAMHELSIAEAHVIREAMSSLESVRSSFTGWLREPSSQLQIDIDHLLTSIAGGLVMAGFDRAGQLLSELRNLWLNQLSQQEQISQQQQELIADILAGVDYFLERLLDSNRIHEKYLQEAEQSLVELGY